MPRSKKQPTPPAMQTDSFVFAGRPIPGLLRAAVRLLGDKVTGVYDVRGARSFIREDVNFCTALANGTLYVVLSGASSRYCHPVVLAPNGEFTHIRLAN